ncbi:MAG: class I SAM-dependent methyltransferase [Victivallaceae bacterium]|nr:class I SAM-dependent methyltransferase [Victivallaceae bacterium]
MPTHQCRVCGNEKENRTYEAREMMFGYRDVFHYFQCSKCNCLQITDFPLNMSKYYPESYFSYKTKMYRNKIEEFLIGIRNKYAFSGKGFIGKLLFDRFPREDLRCLRLLTVTKDSNILDIGCGTGELLYWLRVLGMRNLLGIDPFNAKDIEYENGLRILKKRISEVEGKWDIVMFHHSFEHIPDPVSALKTASNLLNPSGYCVVRIPIVSSYAWNHYGVNWVQLDAPRHFFLHSLESINILAERAKLELWKVVYDSNPLQLWGSEQYLHDISLFDKRSYLHNPKASIFSKKEISAFAKRANELNETKQGDQAIFYFKKL